MEKTDLEKQYDLKVFSKYKFAPIEYLQAWRSEMGKRMVALNPHNGVGVSQRPTSQV